MHSNALNSNTIDFEFIKKRLQLSIPTFVAEPEFQDFFECAINFGSSKSSFIPELIRFGSKSVNQKHRQLRLQAFVETNKVNINCPRTKIASLKRAYRKNPSHGYCPTPEAKFHKAPLSMVLKLEELLHYFHVCCKAAVAVLGTEHQQAALFWPMWMFAQPKHSQRPRRSSLFRRCKTICSQPPTNITID